MPDRYRYWKPEAKQSKWQLIADLPAEREKAIENGWKGFEAEWYFNKIGTAKVNSKTSGNLSACEDFING